MCDPNPISIILISSGSRGDRLLFKYPFETEDIKESLKQGEAYILSNIQIIDIDLVHLHKVSILLLYLSFILLSQPVFYNSIVILQAAKSPDSSCLLSKIVLT